MGSPPSCMDEQEHIPGMRSSPQTLAMGVSLALHQSQAKLDKGTKFIPLIFLQIQES